MVRPRDLARDVALFAARTPTPPPGDAHEQLRPRPARGPGSSEPAMPYEDERSARGSAGRGRSRRPGESRWRSANSTTTSIMSGPRRAGPRARASALGARGHGDARRDAERAPPHRRRDAGARGTLAGALGGPAHAGARARSCVSWNADENAPSSSVTWWRASAPSSSLPGTATWACRHRAVLRLAELDARTALPAHGEPIDDPTSLFRFYVAHRLAREAKVVSALAALADLADLANPANPASAGSTVSRDPRQGVRGHAGGRLARGDAQPPVPPEQAGRRGPRPRGRPRRGHPISSLGS